MVIPQKSQLGEPLWRLCVDYRTLNNLLPSVTKANSKAQGVLTLVPLPKIDEINARLSGSCIYLIFDMRNGNHHMKLY